MWTYTQNSGRLLSQAGTCVASGYSGFGRGKNNPDYQSVPDVGPVPVGFYNIGEPFDDLTPNPPDGKVHHGPFVMRLEPFAENQMFGRDGFLIHGDSIEHPGMASHGCTIFPRAIREMIWNSGDHQLEVISGLPVPAPVVSQPSRS